MIGLVHNVDIHSYSRLDRLGKTDWVRKYMT